MKRALTILFGVGVTPFLVASSCVPPEPCPTQPLMAGETVQLEIVRNTPSGPTVWGHGDTARPCGTLDGIGVGETISITTRDPLFMECGLELADTDVFTTETSATRVLAAGDAEVVGRFNVDFEDGCSGVWEIGYRARSGRDPFGPDVGGEPPLMAIRSFVPALGASCDARVGSALGPSICSDYWDARLRR